ncbi:hypothetical protein F4555_000602 [Mobiluncus mulieris]|uniref:Uncharacterized protein n=1 Tax=Mobiluncus mulieris TaxID=2052 RepID=A0A8G2HRU3_9ACTO|nr:hypothetical protein [Mobiluncus mulieris]MBB5845806.1 hypothetical protein [Mobiluncus mulieris]MCU9994420.1 hypothetical protein [Mobiluncus mulieris]STO15534.1 Uncharacterised protein [Mobiluncus mulieris]
MNSKLKTLVTIPAALSLCIATSGVAAASGDLRDSHAFGESVSTCQARTLDSAGVDGQLVCKIIEVGRHIKPSKDGKHLQTTLSDTQLIQKYAFSEDNLKDFHSVLQGTYTPPVSQLNNIVERSGPRFYISADDLKFGIFATLFTASQVGPEALAAAAVVVSSAIGGPVGAALAGGVALLGIGFFIDLAAKIVGAVAQNKGIAFYPQWGFPPVRIEIE